MHVDKKSTNEVRRKMTDIKLLKREEEKCMRSEANIASLLDISVEAYRAKKEGRVEFCASEIAILTYIFGLEDNAERARSIFFT